MVNYNKRFNINLEYYYIGVKPLGNKTTMTRKLTKLLEGYRNLGRERTRNLFEFARAQSVLDREQIAFVLESHSSRYKEYYADIGGFVGFVGAAISAGSVIYDCISHRNSWPLALTLVPGSIFFSALGGVSGIIISDKVRDLVIRKKMKEYDREYSRLRDELEGGGIR